MFYFLPTFNICNITIFNRPFQPAPAALQHPPYSQWLRAGFGF